ncbi:hypothetical protein KUTeg_018091 [Tegillarca granosa]|uniref:Heme-binding protein 2 n=1 Tax=Tegillarca granosa TaxID=220873 RepID=A0ABQ9EGU3_TEGGR|nr:hypothetical protein KUTeg_018091 [Tegillarca granosa]
MIQILLSMALTSSVIAAGIPKIEQDQPPAFCNKLDCPKFETVQTFKEGYELRRYQPSKWVATNVSAIEFTREINTEMFYKLFYYIAGNNSKHMKIPMTAPVLTNITHGAGPDCESLFEMHFMIPFDLQDDTPSPTDPKLYITTLPQIEAYVRSFGGFPQQNDYVKAVSELADEIKDSSKYNEAFYFEAGYDGPERFTHRHNEVWLGYEIRRYEASRWVATNKTTMEYTDQDRREMFFRLFHYISGNNTQDLKIPMTSPVLTKVSHGPGPTCESDFFMYFMIPFNMQANTPKPTDSKAYIVDMPQMDVFVKSFGGRPSEDDKIHQLELLASEIVDVNQFESSFFFTAGYDGPYTLNRHNEVWLAKI